MEKTSKINTVSENISMTDFIRKKSREFMQKIEL